VKEEISMDMGGKYLSREEEGYGDQHKTEDMRQTKGEERRKRTTRIYNNEIGGGTMG
jgi:hypothetical protein